jgi:hypothetical protein
MAAGLQRELLHSLDVVIARIVHGVRHLARLEGIAQIADGLFDGMAGIEPELLADLLRIDVIGAQIVGRHHLDRYAADHLFHHLGDFHDRVVLVARIEDLAVDRIGGRRETMQIEIGHVRDMDVGALLAAAEDADLAVVDGVVGQDVDRQVEAQARAVAADRRRTQDQDGEAGRPLGQELLLAERLELRVIGQGLQLQVLGDLDALLDAIDRRGRGVDEALDPGRLGGAHQGPEGVVVDRLAKARVELEGGIVGDAGQMDHAVAAGERITHYVGVAQVAAHLPESGMLGNPGQGIAVDEEVEHRHPVAGRE